MNEHSPADLAGFINANNTFVILGHEEPDGDCLGSELVLRMFLRRIGKSATVFSAGPFERPEIRYLEPQFSDHVSDELRSNAVGIIVDCSSLERVGSLADQVAGMTIAVIDHHASGDDFGTPRYVDPDAPSVTLMIQRLMEYMGYSPTKEEAELLLFGLCTDTGFFRHLTEHSAQVFEFTSRIVAAGASPRATYQRMFGGRSLPSRRLLGILLQRTESLMDGRVLTTYESLQDKRDTGADRGDSDTVYQQLQGVEGCEVVVFLREENAQEWSVGLRSINHIDVGAIAKDLGGGGHRNASGYIAEGPRCRIFAALMEHLEPAMRSS